MTFTIGHSNHAIETFIELLLQHQVTALADVRSSPYSRRFPQFNQTALKAELKNVNIAYVPLGDTALPLCYEVQEPHPQPPPRKR